MTTHIIFLHGPSSVGKSTLAKAIQAQAPVAFWHLSIDHFRDSGAWPMARYSDGSLDWTADRAQSFDGFHAMAAAAAMAGNNLIVEHILDTPGWTKTLITAFQPFDVVFVGLHCPLETLVQRETSRGDRRQGSAARDHAQIHSGRRYDLELDATDDPTANAQRVLDYWACGARKSEFSDAAPG